MAMAMDGLLFQYRDVARRPTLLRKPKWQVLPRNWWDKKTETSHQSHVACDLAEEMPLLKPATV